MNVGTCCMRARDRDRGGMPLAHGSVGCPVLSYASRRRDVVRYGCVVIRRRRRHTRLVATGGGVVVGARARLM